jgi:serine phosphatase RsbU (regulator of sigma subunit)
VGTHTSIWVRLDAWRRKVTTPSPELVDVEYRRRAATLANVALALAILLAVSAAVSLFTSIAFPDPDVSLGFVGTAVIALAAVAFWVSLHLARQLRFERGAWCTILTIDLFLLALGIQFDERASVLALGFAVPVLCASIFLRVRGTIGVFVLSVLLTTVLLAVTEVSVVDAAFVLGIMLAVTALTVVVSLLRENDLAQVVRLRSLEQAQSRRLHGELELARKVQQAMLPDQLPELVGVDLAVFSEAAFEASGDFYDVFTLPGDTPTLGVVVCDVAGKGVASALVMSATRAAMRAEAERTDSLASVLAKVNDTLAASVPPELFVTACYLVYQPATRTLRFCSAGHPHPLRFSHVERAVEECESYGMPLGLVAGSEYEEHEVQLAPGDVVMLFTDGLVEALDTERSMYGFPRAAADFHTHASIDGTAASRLDGVLGSMRDFVAEADLEDDVTVVTMAVPIVIDLVDEPQLAFESSTGNGDDSGAHEVTGADGTPPMAPAAEPTNGEHQASGDSVWAGR